ncbi:MAG: sterol desaturase family protein [Xanthomonadaceae bacterium]|nr:sterol desaturase family protein [Xanthomonadaceae bacterium]
MVLIQDTYFYWTHRFLHLPGVYERFHLAHHTSYNPSPLAIYSFHPVEAFINGAIVPCVAFLMPLHFGAIATFILISTIFNSIGHLGYEVYGRRFIKSGLYRWVIGATHHNIHHKYSKENYGFYFRFWDKLMSSESVDYEKNLLEKENLAFIGKSKVIVDTGA